MDIAVVPSVDQAVLDGHRAHTLRVGRREPVLAVVLVGEQDPCRPELPDDLPDPLNGDRSAHQQVARLGGDLGGKLRAEVDTGDDDRHVGAGDPIGSRLRCCADQVRVLRRAGEPNDVHGQDPVRVGPGQSPPGVVVVDRGPQLDGHRVQPRPSETPLDRVEVRVDETRALGRVDPLDDVGVHGQQRTLGPGGEAGEPAEDRPPAARALVWAHERPESSSQPAQERGVGLGGRQSGSRRRGSDGSTFGLERQPIASGHQSGRLDKGVVAAGRALDPRRLDRRDQLVEHAQPQDLLAQPGCVGDPAVVPEGGPLDRHRFHDPGGVRPFVEEVGRLGVGVARGQDTLGDLAQADRPVTRFGRSSPRSIEDGDRAPVERPAGNRRLKAQDRASAVRRYGRLQGCAVAWATRGERRASEDSCTCHASENIGFGRPPLWCRSARLDGRAIL